MHLVLGLAMIQSRMEAERLLLMGIAAPDMRCALTTEHQSILQSTDFLGSGVGGCI